MKRKYELYTGMLCVLFLLGTGCDKEPAVTPGTGEKVPITLSASSLPASSTIQTRTEIKGRTYGIVAAKTDATTLLKDIDWSGYYLDHVLATGTNSKVDGKGEIEFKPLQWWPFNPAEYLAFVAYSPYSGDGGDSRVTRNVATNTLNVEANTTNAFPDFLYTEPVGPYNKVHAQDIQSGVVYLGEFQHAMAKLDIMFKLVDKNGNPINKDKYPNPNPLRITKLEVSSKVNNGAFNLIQTASPMQWTALDDSGIEKTVCTHLNKSTELKANLSSYSCFLLPGTHENSYISVTIEELDAAKKTITQIERKAAIHDFWGKTDDVPIPAILEMGKTTLLTIKVQYVSIPDPDPEKKIILEGQLVEWDYKGKSTVTIE